MSRNLCKNIIFRFKAERIEAVATRQEQIMLTLRIREDVQRIEAQRMTLIAERERDLAELARIEAAAAQGVDPPLLNPNPEEQSIQVKIPLKPYFLLFAGFYYIPELIQGLSAFSHLLWLEWCIRLDRFN